MTGSIKDWFNEGRDAQKNFARKQTTKQVRRVGIKKLPPWHPFQAVKGAGVFYEIIRPYLDPVIRKTKTMKEEHLVLTYRVMKKDAYVFPRFIAMKIGIIKKSNEFEQFQRFIDLAEGRR